jgi:branched-chain amino acid transport system substrate-binding protein
MKVSRRDFVLAPLATGALSLIPRLAPGQTPYRIGVLTPFTGPGHTYMSHTIRGLPLLAKELNQRGGLLGRHPIQLVFRDDETEPEAGARAAATLIVEDRAHALLGTYSSAVALAVQEVIHQHQTLHFAATSNSSRITQENYTPYTYQMCPDSNMQSGAVVRAVAQLAAKNGWQSFVSLGQDYEWGRETHRGFISALAKAAPGLKEVQQLWVRLGETNFTKEISSIRRAKPSFLFGAIAGKDHELFLQQAHQQALFNTVPYPGGLISVTELKHHRKTLPRGLIGLARCPFFAHLNEPLMQQYIRRDRRALGPDAYPDDWACMHYDALHALDQAARKAGSVETAALVKALKGATIDTCRGKLAFRDCSNQLDAPSYIGEVWDSRDYPFPIYKPETLVVVPGNEVWTRTCAEVEKLKKKRA